MGNKAYIDAEDFLLATLKNVHARNVSIDDTFLNKYLTFFVENAKHSKRLCGEEDFLFELTFADLHTGEIDFEKVKKELEGSPCIDRISINGNETNLYQLSNVILRELKNPELYNFAHKDNDTTRLYFQTLANVFKVESERLSERQLSKVETIADNYFALIINSSGEENSNIYERFDTPKRISEEQIVGLDINDTAGKEKTRAVFNHIVSLNTIQDDQLFEG